RDLCDRAAVSVEAHDRAAILEGAQHSRATESCVGLTSATDQSAEVEFVAISALDERDAA
ncbi:MAG: hypothetical protein ACHREM_29765, partial [Polyangiales bacterium]